MNGAARLCTHANTRAIENTHICTESQHRQTGREKGERMGSQLSTNMPKGDRANNQSERDSDLTLRGKEF